MRAMLVGGMGILTLAMPAAAQTMASPPVPVGSAVDWIHPDDYPPASIRMGEEGRVSVQLAVDATGAVTGCTVTNSSGHPLLDARTCTLLTLRGRFQPARDAAGQAVAATTPVMSLRWQLPQGTALPETVVPSATDRPATREEMKKLSDLMGSIAAPPLPPTQLVTPARLQRISPLWQVVDAQRGIEAMMAITLEQTEKQLMQNAVNLPPVMRPVAQTDLRAAFHRAEQRYIAGAKTRLLSYFAARLSDAETDALLAFFASDEGKRFLSTMGSISPPDKLARGAALFSHPELMKYAKLTWDYAQQELAVRHNVSTAFQADWQMQLCHDLARDRIQLAACPAIRPVATKGKARPPRLLTTHL